jgi:mRNA interferase RelE/StbE
MYSVEFTKEAQRYFNKIPKGDALILSKRINSIRENPFPHLRKLKGSKLWRLRVLKYRIIIDVLVSGKRIIVLRIGHRKNIY